MARYIDADLLLSKMDGRYRQIINVVDDSLAEGFLAVDRLIHEQPTADVKEVVRGEWQDYLPSPDWVRDDGKTVFLECSECHKAFCRNFFPADSRNFCPNCGADMRGVE